MIPVSGAKAGEMGSQYRKVLTFASKATGNYIVNDTNFPGLGTFLPAWVTIASGTPANVTVQLTTDGGTTWRTAAAQGGTFWVDSSETVRIVIATSATDIFLFPVITD
jgi:hypothetical protein